MPRCPRFPSRARPRGTCSPGPAPLPPGTCGPAAAGGSRGFPGWPGSTWGGFATSTAAAGKGSAGRERRNGCERAAGVTR